MEESAAACLAAGGVLHGDVGATCDTDFCPGAAACCIPFVPAPESFCIDTLPSVCVALSGFPLVGAAPCGASGGQCPVDATASCCFANGTCADDVRVSDCQAGELATAVQSCAPEHCAAAPVVECPPGAVCEREPLCYLRDGDDSYSNNGCFSDEPEFAYADCATTYCGTLATHAISYDVPSGTVEYSVDTDWYVVAHPGGADLRATLRSTVPTCVSFASIDDTHACSSFTYAVDQTIGCARDGVTLVDAVAPAAPAGTYLVIVSLCECDGAAPHDIGLYACDTEVGALNYTLEIGDDCTADAAPGACCVAAAGADERWCEDDVLEAECTDGGVWQGAHSKCLLCQHTCTSLRGACCVADEWAPLSPVCVENVTIAECAHDHWGTVERFGSTCTQCSAGSVCATVTGTVYNDVNGNEAYNTGESTLPGARVRLRDAEGQTVATTHADAHGVYSFGPLPSGTYAARGDADIEHAGRTYVPVATRNSEARSVQCADAAVELSGAHLYYRVLYYVRGVVLVDGGGADGITVEVRDSESAPVATLSTDADGRYAVEGLDPARSPYAFSVVAPPGCAATLDVDLVVAVTLGVNIDVLPFLIACNSDETSALVAAEQHAAVAEEDTDVAAIAAACSALSLLIVCLCAVRVAAVRRRASRRSRS